MKVWLRKIGGFLSVWGPNVRFLGVDTYRRYLYPIPNFYLMFVTIEDTLYIGPGRKVNIQIFTYKHGNFHAVSNRRCRRSVSRDVAERD